MPDPKKVHDLLTAAGFAPSRTIPQRPGYPAQAIPGFLIQVSGVERRSLRVFHSGKREKKFLARYEMALVAAGYIVTSQRGGLKVITSRNPEDRATPNQRASESASE